MGCNPKLVASLLVAVLFAACTPGDPNPEPSASPTAASPTTSAPTMPDASESALSPLVGGEVGARPLQLRDGPLEVDLTGVEVTEEGVRVRLAAFNGGGSPVVLVEDAETTYADPGGGGEDLGLVPPDELPIVVDPGAEAELDLAFAGRLGSDAEVVDVLFNRRDGEFTGGEDVMNWRFQLGLGYPQVGDGTSSPAPTAVYPQDRTAQRDEVSYTATEVEATDDSVFVTFDVRNERSTPVRLFTEDAEQVFLRDDRGGRYPGVPPEGTDGELGPGDEATVRLGFRGRLADDARTVTMYLNYVNEGSPVAGPDDELVSVFLPNLQVREAAP